MAMTEEQQLEELGKIRWSIGKYEKSGQYKTIKEVYETEDWYFKYCLGTARESFRQKIVRYLQLRNKYPNPPTRQTHQKFKSQSVSTFTPTRIKESRTSRDSPHIYNSSSASPAMNKSFQLPNNDAEIQKLNKDILELYFQNRKLNEKVQSHRFEIIELEKNSEERISRLQESLDKEIKRNKILEERLKKGQVERTFSLDESAISVLTLETSVRESELYKQLLKEHEDLKRDYNKIKNYSLAEKNKEIFRLEKELQGLRKQVAKMEQEKENQQNKEQSLNQLLQKTKYQLENANILVRRVEKSLNQPQNQRNKLIEQNNRLRERLKNFEQINRQVNERRASLKSKVTELKEQLAYGRHALEVAQSEIEILKHKFNQATKQLNSKLVQSQKLREDLATQFNQLKEQLQKHKHKEMALRDTIVKSPNMMKLYWLSILESAN